MTQTFQRAVLIAVFFLILPPPLNTWDKAGIFGIYLALLFLGELKPFTRRNLALLAVLVLTARVSSYALPRVEIQEGFNFFLLGPSEETLKNGLPAPVFEEYRKGFLDAYPESSWCDAKRDGCWRGPHFGITHKLASPYAFSADSAFDDPKYSRVSDDIYVAGSATLRGGFVNAIGHGENTHWYDLVSDIDRNTAPFFVMYELPKTLIGSQFCWIGDVTAVFPNGAVKTYSAPSKLCSPINESLTDGTRLYGLSMPPQRVLKVILEKSPTALFLTLWPIVLAVVFLGLVAGTFLKIPAARAAEIGALVALSLARDALAKKYLQAMRFVTIHTGGNDALTHIGFGRSIFRYAIEGNWHEALRGEESVFYFMPGMRYLNALMTFLFGENHLGTVLLVLLAPIGLLAVLRRVAPRGLAWTVTALFIASLCPEFTFNFLDHSVLGFNGWPDQIATVFFLCGLALVMDLTLREKNSLGCSGAAGLLLLALTVVLRPNFLGAAVFSVSAVFALNRHLLRQPCVWAGLAAGGLILLLPLAHNLYFGGEFVPFTASAAIPVNLKATPKLYAAALLDLMKLDWDATAFVAAKEQLAAWLSPLAFKLPLLLGVTVTALYKKSRALLFAPPRLILLAAAAGAQAPLPFWVAEHRYGLLAWTLTALAAATALAALRESHPLKRI